MRSHYTFSCKRRDVTEHDLCQLFVDVPSSRFSFGGGGWGAADRNYRDCLALQPDVTFSIQMIDK